MSSTTPPRATQTPLHHGTCITPRSSPFAGHPDVLAKCHSTIMEAANGLSCLEYAMRNWPALAYIEIYDSVSSTTPSQATQLLPGHGALVTLRTSPLQAAATDIFRSMTSRCFAMRGLLQARFDLLNEFSGARALPFWQNREAGFIGVQPRPTAAPSPPPVHAHSSTRVLTNMSAPPLGTSRRFHQVRAADLHGSISSPPARHAAGARARRQAP